MSNILGNHIVFANTLWLWLLLLIPIIAIVKYLNRKNNDGIYRYSNIPKSILQQRVPLLVRLRWILDVLFYLGLALAILAMARPQTLDAEEKIKAEGIDIVVCLDVSGSMLAEDFKPNRLEAAKEISEQFIISRPSDRVGLVVFSGESFTQCPLTLDHRVVIEQLRNVRNGLLRDGTAIGNGLATAIDRLKEGKGKSKVVILMTDGEESKMGGNTIDPLTALEIAKTFGVKVYTIGVGTIGRAIVPMNTPEGGKVRQWMDVKIDEPLLRKIADETGGNYYRATTNVSLKKVYESIDKLEKTTIDMTSFKNFNDVFYIFLIPAVVLLVLGSVLRFTLFKSLT